QLLLRVGGPFEIALSAALARAHLLRRRGDGQHVRRRPTQHAERVDGANAVSEDGPAVGLARRVEIVLRQPALQQRLALDVLRYAQIDTVGPARGLDRLLREGGERPDAVQSGHGRLLQRRGLFLFAADLVLAPDLDDGTLDVVADDVGAGGCLPG